MQMESFLFLLFLWPVYQYIMPVVAAVMLLWLQLQYTASVVDKIKIKHIIQDGDRNDDFIMKAANLYFFSKSSNWDKWSLNVGNCTVKKKNMHSEKKRKQL